MTTFEEAQAIAQMLSQRQREALVSNTITVAEIEELEGMTFREFCYEMEDFRYGNREIVHFMGDTVAYYLGQRVSDWREHEVQRLDFWNSPKQMHQIFGNPAPYASAAVERYLNAAKRCAEEA